MAQVWWTQRIVSHKETLRLFFVFAGDRQLRRLQWSDADGVEVRFRGHKGDQAQAGSVIVRTRSEVRGTCSELGARRRSRCFYGSTMVMFCGST